MKWVSIVVVVVFLVVLTFCKPKSPKTVHAAPPLMEEITFEAELDTQNLVAQNAIFETSHPVSISEFNQPAPVFQPSLKSPMLAATLAIVPGLGHVYLNDLKTASALASTAGIGVGLYFGSNEKVQTSGVIGLEMTEFYSVYSAYRDARQQKGVLAYSYPMPQESLAELAYAPFQWSVIKKPEVWIGIATTLGLAAGALYLSGNAEASVASVDRADMPYLALPIGIGEEAFFRGFLQSALAEVCTPWGGIGLSSVAFGLAHIRNAYDLSPEDRYGYFAFGLPLITGLGLYYGWLTYKNHSLKQSVAAHTWYNFIVIMTTAIIQHRASVGKTGFALSLTF